MIPDLSGTPKPMYKNLKKVRIIFAGLFFLIILASFLHFSSGWGTQWTLKTQFVPSLLAVFAGSALAFILLIVLTLLLGRVYCSFLCPLGIFQDIIGRISVAIGKKKKKKKNGGYKKPHNILRYSILGIVGVLFAAGISYPLALLDPYSGFGKIAGQIFGNIELSVTNLLSEIFPSAIYYQQYVRFSLGSFLFALIFFLIIVLMSAFRGRLYCNTICPVGSLLGLISGTSLLRPAIQKDKCVRCRACVSECKSNCIDLETKEIDVTRCVACYNCMASCKKGSIVLAPAWRKPGSANKATEAGNTESSSANAGQDKQEIKESPTRKIESIGRRNALIAMGALGTAMAAKGLLKKETPAGGVSSGGKLGIAPPGAQSITHLKQYCTACHACVAACPNGIIKPAALEYGIDGFMLPTLKYNYKFCAYDCNICSQVCPDGALMPLTIEEKHLTQIGKAHFRKDHCIIVKDGTDCGACDEHCPTKAITMQPYKDGLLLPHLNQDICIGCGGCEYVCPATPKAMVIMANAVQTQAIPPKVEKQEKIQVDDFGF